MSSTDAEWAEWVRAVDRANRRPKRIAKSPERAGRIGALGQDDLLGALREATRLEKAQAAKKKGKDRLGSDSGVRSPNDGG